MISKANLSSSAFRAADRGASVTALPKKTTTGTDVRYRDSQPATTTFSVLKPTVGHRKGFLCVAGAPVKKQQPCSRFVSAGSFTHRDLPRKVIKVHFTGRVRGQKLEPGPYVLELTPKAGGSTGRTVSLAFRIIR